MLSIGRLAVDHRAERYHRIDAEHGVAGAALRDRGRLAVGVLDRDLLGRALLELVDVG
jgi:hypothetical protein